MTCPHCGSEQPDATGPCTTCGQPLDVTPTPSPYATPATPVAPGPATKGGLGQFLLGVLIGALVPAAFGIAGTAVTAGLGVVLSILAWAIALAVAIRKGRRTMAWGIGVGALLAPFVFCGACMSLWPPRFG